MSNLRALSFTVKNVEGIAGPVTLNIRHAKPGEGQLYEIKGANGEGKSSFLHGLLALSASDFDPSIVNDNAEKSEIVLTYADGSDVTTVSRTITRLKKEGLIVKTEGVPPKKLEPWIKQMMGSGFGQNPLDFCCPNGGKADAKKRKERLDYLMVVADVQLMLPEVSACLNGAEHHLERTDRPKATLTLAEVNKLIRDLIAVRGPLVTKRDDRVAAGERFRKTLALKEQVDATDWKLEVENLTIKRNAVLRDEAEEVDEIAEQLRMARKILGERKTQADDDANQAWQTMLKYAREGTPGVDSDLNGLLTALRLASGNLTKVEADARSATEKSRAAHATELQGLASQISAAQSHAEEQIRTQGIRTEMETCQRQAAEYTATWELIDGAVKSLDALKKLKLKKLPESLNGLEVSDDDDILVNGRSFDKLNTAQQYIWSMRIGAVGAGDLGIIVADEAEHLDANSMKLVRAAVKESGLIFIFARVDSPEELAKTGGRLRSEPAGALVVK